MTGLRNEPKTALNVIDTELIENAVCPSSEDLEVPIAWEAQPIAIPMLTGLVIFKSRKNCGPRMAPVRPANITKIAVMLGMPPAWLESSIAIGVVNDFGKIE